MIHVVGLILAAGCAGILIGFFAGFKVGHVEGVREEKENQAWVEKIITIADVTTTPSERELLDWDRERG